MKLTSATVFDSRSHLGRSADAAGEQTEALRVALFAPVEQELEAEADPEHVRAAVGGRPDGAGQAGGSQALHRGARRADPGDDEQP